jgi:predicted adenylyl cyclase CyaB
LAAMLEIEVKIRTDELQAVRNKLEGMGAQVLQERHREDNTLYDYRSRELTKKKQALRLRRRGGRTVLTFKGAPQPSRRFKVREEFETEVRDEKQARRIFKALGLIPVFEYAKHRTVLRLGRVRLCLDETAIGNFLEIEGERNRITALLRSLGIPSRAMIKRDYVEMLQEAGRVKKRGPA